MKCRFIEPIGLRYEATFTWESSSGHHIARIPITKEQWDLHDLDELKKQLENVEKKCECHNEIAQEPTFIGSGARTVWNTEDGENNHPGDMYWAPWMHDDGRCMYWDNCKDPRGHLIVALPNGHYFDTDSRASNCKDPKERTHRCWEKKGELPLITIGGPTSDNGVGSIGFASWHGYLTNGELHN